MKHNFLYLINYDPDLFRFLSIALYAICISKSYVLNSACHSLLDVPSFYCSLQLSNRKNNKRDFSIVISGINLLLNHSPNEWFSLYKKWTSVIHSHWSIVK